MLRRYTNVSGSPEIKIRRQSPVIGGARLYPGSTITFTQSEYDTLDRAAKLQLEALCLMDPPVLTLEEIPDPISQIEAEVVEEVEVEETETDTGEVEVEETETDTGEVEVEEVVENVETGVGADEETGESEKVTESETPETKAEEVETTTEEATKEVAGDFDYAALLSLSIAKIKKQVPDLLDTIDVNKLIELEKASKSPRGTLVVWLEQYTN